MSDDSKLAKAVGAGVALNLLNKQTKAKEKQVQLTQDLLDRQETSDSRQREHFEAQQRTAEQSQAIFRAQAQAEQERHQHQQELRGNFEYAREKLYEFNNLFSGYTKEIDSKKNYKFTPKKLDTLCQDIENWTSDSEFIYESIKLSDDTYERHRDMHGNVSNLVSVVAKREEVLNIFSFLRSSEAVTLRERKAELVEMSINYENEKSLCMLESTELLNRAYLLREWRYLGESGKYGVKPYFRRTDQKMVYPKIKSYRRMTF